MIKYVSSKSSVFLKLNSFPKLAVNVALQIESPYQFHHARCGAKYFKTVNSSEIKKDYINTYTMLVLVGRMLSMINWNKKIQFLIKINLRTYLFFRAHIFYDNLSRKLD